MKGPRFKMKYSIDSRTTREPGNTRRRDSLFLCCRAFKLYSKYNMHTREPGNTPMSVSARHTPASKTRWYDPIPYAHSHSPYPMTLPDMGTGVMPHRPAGLFAVGEAIWYRIVSHTRARTHTPIHVWESVQRADSKGTKCTAHTRAR